MEFYSDEDESIDLDESDNSNNLRFFSGFGDDPNSELPGSNGSSGRISAMREIESALEELALRRALEDFPENRS